MHPRLPLVLGVCSLLCGCAASMMFRVKVEDLDSSLKLFLGGGGNSTVLLHGQSDALLVDTKYRMFSRRLRRELEVELARHVRRIVLTHAHSDHAAGLPLYPSTGAVLVHPNARRRLEAEGIRAPYVEVDREIRLNLAGEEVHVLSVGSGHTDGDLVALLPGRKLLVAGDLITNGVEPYCDPKFGGDILTLARTWPRLMALDFETVVPGHGEPMPRAQVQKLADYLVALEAAVQAARAAGKTEDQTAAEVKLPEYPLDEVLFVSSREGNVRAMFRALGR
ncbi:MAG: beta-lactamase-like protein [Myxococcaceae bacterium]|nr:beta-lactamase-like protein [Myxococcaceae bacterium]